LAQDAGVSHEAEVDHRRLAVNLFNHTWTFLDLLNRTPEQDDEMIHSAHASRHHWGETGRWPNIAVGEWQCSRVYAVPGRAEPALWHARRSLELCREHGVDDYRLTAAFEALARATVLTGDAQAARQWNAQALEACAAVADSRDRAPIVADLESLGVWGKPTCLGLCRRSSRGQSALEMRSSATVWLPPWISTRKCLRRSQPSSDGVLAVLMSPIRIVLFRASNPPSSRLKANEAKDSLHWKEPATPPTVLEFDQREESSSVGVTPKYWIASVAWRVVKAAPVSTTNGTAAAEGPNSSTMSPMRTSG
jgi:hypothetical protein